MWSPRLEGCVKKSPGISCSPAAEARKSGGELVGLVSQVPRSLKGSPGLGTGCVMVEMGKEG